MESATVLTDHAERPRLTVSVNVLVKTDLYANPEVVDFGTVSLSDIDRSPRLLELLTQPVMLRRRQGGFEIKSVESSIPAVNVVREPAKGSSESFRLDVSLVRSKLQPGPLEGIDPHSHYSRGLSRGRGEGLGNGQVESASPDHQLMLGRASIQQIQNRPGRAQRR